MRAILALGLAIPFSICAQTLTGTVVDVDGKPIEGVRIDHVVFADSIKTTDGDGHFAVLPKGPAVVLRKLGYQSKFVPVNTSVELRLVLLTDPPKEFPACEGHPPCYSLGGSEGFCFPKLKHVSASPLGHGIDAMERNYLAGSGSKGILHGNGTSWSFGIPDARNVWASVDYFETVFTNGTRVIRDSRGKTESGKFWRDLDTVGESASYHDADAATANLFNRLLDGACWLASPKKQDR